MELTKKHEHIIYQSSVQTDITRRWRMHGWVPPSEQPEYQQKWARVQLESRLLSNATLEQQL